MQVLVLLETRLIQGAPSLLPETAGIGSSSPLKLLVQELAGIENGWKQDPKSMMSISDLL